MQGMPSGHRAEVWLCTSRAKQRKRHNKGMYWTLLEVHANESSAHTTQIIKVGRLNPQTHKPPFLPRSDWVA